MRRWLFWLIFLAALAALFYPLVMGEALFWGLPSLQFIPWRVEAQRMLADGTLPLWNAYSGAGAPLLANYQSALLYPPSWLTLIFPIPQAMSLTAVAHLGIAAFGMARLGAALGMAPFARAVSAVAFALGGYLLARLGTFPVVQAAAWLPWLLWALTRLVERPTARRIGAVAVVAALLLLAGHAQTAWYALTLAGAYTLFAWLARANRRPLSLAAALGAVALAALVGAVQLASTAELLLASARSDGVERDFALNYSYAPARALNLIAPQAFGTPANGSYITGGAYFEDAVYIGLIPLIAAGAALAAALRGKIARAPIFFWSGVVLVGFVLALGLNSPVFPFLFEHVPTFDLFQAPVRWHLWTVTGLSLLAGYGVSAWGRDRRTRRWSRRALAAAVAAVILGALAPTFISGGGRALVLLANAVVSVAALAVVAALLTLVQPPHESKRRWLWEVAALGVIVADLVVAGWGLNPTVSASFYAPRATANESERTFWPADVLQMVRFETFLRFDNYLVASARIDDYRASALPNLNLLERQPAFTNFDPLLPAAHAEFVELLNAAPTAGLLRAAGVSRVAALDGWVEAEPAPRAWLVEAVCWHEDDTRLRAALVDPAWDSAALLHMQGDAGCADPKGRQGRVSITADTGTALTLAVTAERDAWLVLADTAYPGWSAWVNGASAPIYTANLAFRAVQVPGGASTVEMRYEPAWALPALLISLLGVIGVVLLLRLNDAPAARGGA